MFLLISFQNKTVHEKNIIIILTLYIRYFVFFSNIFVKITLFFISMHKEFLKKIQQNKHVNQVQQKDLNQSILICFSYFIIFD